MRFHYDVTQASPVMRDMPLYIAGSAGTVAGQALAACLDDDTEGNGCAVAATATSMVDFLGVTTEAVSDGTSVIATGVSFYQKLILNPCAVYLAEADDTNEGTNTVANSTGEVVTITFSANNLGGWLFCTGPSTDTAYGNLFKAGALSTTASLTNATGAAYDDELGANTTSSTYILLPSILGGGVAGGSHDLNTACTKLDAKPAPTGANILALENYINSKRFPFEPLRIEKHGGKKDPSAKFYVDVMFPDAVVFNGVD
jgi:hypothetical protein